MINKYLQYLNESINPKILFHGSNKQGLKELNPLYNKSNIYDTKGKWLYAAISKTIASAFTFLWIDPMGIKFGASHWHSGNPLYTMQIPKKHLPLLNNPCSIYEISSQGFEEAKGGLKGEFRTSKKVKVLREYKYKTSKECMLENNVKIEVI